MTTRKRTDTDVFVTFHSTEWDHGEPFVPMSGYRRIGPWFYRDTLRRRRLWTVQRDWLASNDVDLEVKPLPDRERQRHKSIGDGETWYLVTRYAVDKAVLSGEPRRGKWLETQAIRLEERKR